jgi:hypothetical protein
MCVTSWGSSRRYSTAGGSSSSRTEWRLSSREDGLTISPNRNESHIWRTRSRRKMRFGLMAGNSDRGLRPLQIAGGFLQVVVSKAREHTCSCRPFAP